MADTGAPHFIPYIEPSDLVRDYPAADEAQAEAIAAALDAAGGLVAVKHVIKTDTHVESVSGNGTTDPIPGLSVSITPTDASHRVIVWWSLAVAAGHSGTAPIIFRDGSGLFLGDAAGSRTRTSGGGFPGDDSISGNVMGTASGVAVDIPNTTSQVTYTVRLMNNRGSAEDIYVNRGVTDNNSGRFPRGSSSIILAEVKV